MNAAYTIPLVAAATVIVFDALGATASRVVGFNYESLFPVSLLIYATAGYLAARRGGIKAALLCGVIVGLTDATVGWAVSWLIGPGRSSGLENLSELEYTLAVIMAAAAAVLMAVACACLGGLASKIPALNKHP
jgi:ascorbate-specific PTS system EIIC-type component UlaA